MHPDDEHVFVVGAVEDADATALRQALHVAPEERVIEVFARGLLEREDLAALRIDAGEDVLDGAVLPGRIRGLQHDQHRMRVGRIEPLLRVREIGDVLAQDLRGVRLELVFRQLLELLLTVPVWFVVVQAHPASSGNLKQTTNFLQRECHARAPARTSQQSLRKRRAMHPLFRRGLVSPRIAAFRGLHRFPRPPLTTCCERSLGRQEAPRKPRTSLEIVKGRTPQFGVRVLHPRRSVTSGAAGRH